MQVSLSTTPGPSFAAINWIYQSWNRAKPYVKGHLDREVRHPEWTDKLLTAIGRPDARMNNIAVTGSKGKGSHAILLAGLLQQLGLRVGLFTGPHLVDFMERFRVNGMPMKESDFQAYVEALKPQVASFQLPPHAYFGPVGLLGVIATQWFLHQETDVNVFELGRGALHDDVNQIKHTGAVVAPIFLEHQRELGSTLEEVGREKAGVVTPETKWVVMHPQTPPVNAAFDEVLQHRETLRLGHDCLLEHVGEVATDTVVRALLGDERIEVMLPAETGPVPNPYLVENVVVAVAAARQIWRDLRGNAPFPELFDLRALRLWGRLEKVSDAPEVLVDGCIHGQSAEMIRNYLEDRRARGFAGRVYACIGIPSDKDGVGVVRALADQLAGVVFCQAHNRNLEFDETFTGFARTCIDEVATAPFLEQALQRCQRWFHKDDLLLILGTQSFVGDAMRVFDVNTRSIWENGSAFSAL